LPILIQLVMFANCACPAWTFVLSFTYGQHNFILLHFQPLNRPDKQKCICRRPNWICLVQIKYSKHRIWLKLKSWPRLDYAFASKSYW
jgi:hypothetical protein